MKAQTKKKASADVPAKRSGAPIDKSSGARDMATECCACRCIHMYICTHNVCCAFGVSPMAMEALRRMIYAVAYMCVYACAHVCPTTINIHQHTRFREMLHYWPVLHHSHLVVVIVEERVEPARLRCAPLPRSHATDTSRKPRLNTVHSDCRVPACLSCIFGLSRFFTFWGTNFNP